MEFYKVNQYKVCFLYFPFLSHRLCHESCSWISITSVCVSLFRKRNVRNFYYIPQSRLQDDFCSSWSLVVEQCTKDSTPEQVAVPKTITTLWESCPGAVHHWKVCSPLFGVMLEQFVENCNLLGGLTLEKFVEDFSCGTDPKVKQGNSLSSLPGEK